MSLNSSEVLLPNFIFKGNQKLQIALALLNKKHTKHLVSLNGFCVQTNLAKQKLFSYVTINADTEMCYIYYANNLIFEVLKIIKKNGYIFNYYKVPFQLFEGYLIHKKFFKPPLVIVYFNYNFFGGENAFETLKLLSIRHSQKFLTKNECIKMGIKVGELSPVYILSTIQGLITVQQAVQNRIGGKLLLYLK